jgi:hypothetical protein
LDIAKRFAEQVEEIIAAAG